MLELDINQDQAFFISLYLYVIQNNINYYLDIKLKLEELSLYRIS